MKVARYHGADSRVIRLLEDKPKDKLKATGGRDAWDEKLHASRKAAAKDAWCDCCVSVGTFFLIPPGTALFVLLSINIADVEMIRSFVESSTIARPI